MRPTLVVVRADSFVGNFASQGGAVEEKVLR